MNTIQKLQETNYALFDALPDKRKRGAQVQAIKYIKRLASVSNTDIADWDITAVFGEDGMIATDRNKINQLFFTYKDSSPKVPKPLHHSTVAAIQRLQEMRRFGDTTQLEKTIKSQEQDMNVYYQEFMVRMQTVAKTRRQIEMMKGYSPNYPAQIAKILEEGFWKYLEIDTTLGWITFETVNDIVLRDYNPKQGVKYSVNLGKFKFKLNVQTNEMKCYPSAGNAHFSYRSGHAPHPHVNSSGTICFGELKTDSHLALTGGDIGEILNLVQRTLTSFHSGNPYIQLASLKKLKEDYVRDYGSQQEKEEMAEETGAGSSAPQQPTGQQAQQGDASVPRF